MTTNTVAEVNEHIGSVSERITRLHDKLQDDLQTQRQFSTIQAANVLNPLSEVPKLSSLLTAHATKLGLVFKPPIKETTYKTCLTEIDSFAKYVVYLDSLLRQIQLQKSTLSCLFADMICSHGLAVIEVSRVLVSELQKLITEEEKEEVNEEVDENNVDQRLISVGIVWQACEDLTKTCKNGSSGVLRVKLKESNKLVVDALDELKEWLENPVVGGSFDIENGDIFGLNDDKVPSGLKEEDDDEEEEGEDEELADEEVINFGQKWSTKIQLIKLLISLLDKSIPTSKYNVKFSKSLDLLHEKTYKVNEHIDDIVASLVYDNDIENAQTASKSLDKEITEIVDLVRKLNNNDVKRCKWLDSWKLKYKE